MSADEKPEFRLPWRRTGENEFTALPEGEGYRCTRMARLAFNDKFENHAWEWSIRYDDAKASGYHADRQKASDQCNRQWPLVKEEAARMRREAMAKLMLEQRIREIGGGAPMSPDEFSIETQSSAYLRELIRLAKAVYAPNGVNPPKPMPGMVALMNEASGELAKRRGIIGR